MPVLEERLEAETRAVDLGELRVHKRVETEEARVTQEVTRDDLLTSSASRSTARWRRRWCSRVEGDWYVVPVMEEVLVVRKQLMLKEEVRIRRRPVTEAQEVRETLRRERVELEDATRHGVREAAAPPAAREQEQRGQASRAAAARGLAAPLEAATGPRRARPEAAGGGAPPGAAPGTGRA